MPSPTHGTAPSATHGGRPKPPFGATNRCGPVYLTGLRIGRSAFWIDHRPDPGILSVTESVALPPFGKTGAMPWIFDLTFHRAENHSINASPMKLSASVKRRVVRSRALDESD